MVSNALEPKIEKGQQFHINKAAYGLRAPFLSTYVLRWGIPERGDLIIFETATKTYLREVLSVSQNYIIVKDLGNIPRKKVLGKALIL